MDTGIVCDKAYLYRAESSVGRPDIFKWTVKSTVFVGNNYKWKSFYSTEAVKLRRGKYIRTLPQVAIVHKYRTGSIR